MDWASEQEGDGDAVVFPIEPEVEEMARLHVGNGSGSDGTHSPEQQRMLASERDRTQQQDVARCEVDRRAKRQRLQTDATASPQKEIDALQLQIKRNSELHQIELGERDVLLVQLRRQLTFAAAEEEETRNELRVAVSEHSSEKLQSQKKIVELDSKLQFVESALSEWKERALESESQLRTVTRQSKLKIQLLEDRLEVATTAANAAKAQLIERDSGVQSANTSMVRAVNTVENARDVGALNEKIERLETAERALKAELVDLIESSKHVSALEEKLYQAQKQLHASAAAQPVDEVMKELESSHETAAVPTAAKEYEIRIARLEQEVAGAKRQNSNLTRHLEKSEMELAVLEKRLGKGEFNAETTKIVHLSVNPTSEVLESKSKSKSSEVEKLRQENEILRSKLERLSGGSGVEMTPAAASTSAFTTTTSYETVEGQKLLNKRLKEVFREQIQHYREAVHLLTGYKIDLRKSNGMELLRLRSVYADHEDDELLVRMETDGALELLETDFCAQINQRVLAYLTTCRSFPAFLATLTLHLFEKQTFQSH